jgi:signal transduction histidine kinase
MGMNRGIILCAFTVVAIAACLLWLRVRQTCARIQDGHEVRLTERDRIARDLHDTLLQSTEGLILKVYMAAQQLPPGDPIRSFLMRALDQAEALAVEGRRKLLGLRDPMRSRVELSQALAALGLELLADTTTSFSAAKKGRVRALGAAAWDEVYCIAREAIVNAFKHAHADHIEAIVTYRSSSLMVQVRDDGCGVPAHRIADASADDRLGLRGMRERAQQLRARLEIDTAENEGTAITLVVPAPLVYRTRFVALLKPPAPTGG